MELLEQINGIGWYAIAMSIFVIVLGVPKAVKAWKDFKDSTGLISQKTIKERQLEERLQRIEKRITDVDKRVTDTSNLYENRLTGYHGQSIEIRGQLADKQDELNNKVDSLTDMFSQFINRENETTVAMFRSSLWRLHRDFTQQGFVTPDGLKTFMEMGKVYTAAGGNDIYHEKLLPEVEALEIRYPDGGVYN